MKNAVNRALAAKKWYIQPCTESISVQLTTPLLSASGGNTLPIDNNGAQQIDAW